MQIISLNFFLFDVFHFTLFNTNAGQVNIIIIKDLKHSLTYQKYLRVFNNIFGGDISLLSTVNNFINYHFGKIIVIFSKFTDCSSQKLLTTLKSNKFKQECFDQYQPKKSYIPWKQASGQLISH